MTKTQTEVNTRWMCGSFYRPTIGNWPTADKSPTSPEAKTKRFEQFPWLSFTIKTLDWFSLFFGWQSFWRFVRPIIVWLWSTATSTQCASSNISTRSGWFSFSCFFDSNDRENHDLFAAVTWNTSLSTVSTTIDRQRGHKSFAISTKTSKKLKKKEYKSAFRYTTFV